MATEETPDSAPLIPPPSVERIKTFLSELAARRGGGDAPGAGVDSPEEDDPVDGAPDRAVAIVGRMLPRRRSGSAFPALPALGDLQSFLEWLNRVGSLSTVRPSVSTGAATGAPGDLYTPAGAAARTYAGVRTARPTEGMYTSARQAAASPDDEIPARPVSVPPRRTVRRVVQPEPQPQTLNAEIESGDIITRSYATALRPPSVRPAAIRSVPVGSPATRSVPMESPAVPPPPLDAEPAAALAPPLTRQVVRRAAAPLLSLALFDAGLIQGRSSAALAGTPFQPPQLSFLSPLTGTPAPSIGASAPVLGVPGLPLNAPSMMAPPRFPLPTFANPMAGAPSLPPFAPNFAGATPPFAPQNPLVGNSFVPPPPIALIGANGSLPLPPVGSNFAQNFGTMSRAENAPLGRPAIPTASYLGQAPSTPDLPTAYPPPAAPRPDLLLPRLPSEIPGDLLRGSAEQMRAPAPLRQPSPSPFAPLDRLRTTISDLPGTAETVPPPPPIRVPPRSLTTFAGLALLTLPFLSANAPRPMPFPLPNEMPGLRLPLPGAIPVGTPRPMPFPLLSVAPPLQTVPHPFLPQFPEQEGQRVPSPMPLPRYAPLHAHRHLHFPFPTGEEVRHPEPHHRVTFPERWHFPRHQRGDEETTFAPPATSRGIFPAFPPHHLQPQRDFEPPILPEIGRPLIISPFERRGFPDSLLPISGASQRLPEQPFGIPPVLGGGSILGRYLPFAGEHMTGTARASADSYFPRFAPPFIAEMPPRYGFGFPTAVPPRNLPGFPTLFAAGSGEIAPAPRRPGLDRLQDRFIDPRLGQITLIAPPIAVASAESERHGMMVQMNWQQLARTVSTLDEAGLVQLHRLAPGGMQVLYPALPPGGAGANAVNLPLDSGLTSRLMGSGYGVEARLFAAEASARGRQATPSFLAQPLDALLVPTNRPSASGGGFGLFAPMPGDKRGGDALEEAGSGTRRGGGTVNFLGVPVSLAPSLRGDMALASEPAALQTTRDPQPYLLRPDAWAPLRQRLFPGISSVAAELDTAAWRESAPRFGLRDDQPATLFAPDARAGFLTDSPLPEANNANSISDNPLGALAPRLFAGLYRQFSGRPPTQPMAITLGVAAHSFFETDDGQMPPLTFQSAAAPLPTGLGLPIMFGGESGTGGSYPLFTGTAHPSSFTTTTRRQSAASVLPRLNATHFLAGHLPEPAPTGLDALLSGIQQQTAATFDALPAFWRRPEMIAPLQARGTRLGSQSGAEPILQRAVTEVTSSNNATTAPPPTTGASGEARQDRGTEVNGLATEVYAILRRRLSWEAERSGRR